MFCPNWGCLVRLESDVVTDLGLQAQHLREVFLPIVYADENTVMPPR